MDITTILIVFGLALAIVALSFAGIAVKIIVKKNGEFKRHCSSVDPYTGQRSGCVCARKVSDPCDEDKIKGSTKHKYHPLEINQELLEEL